MVSKGSKTLCDTQSTLKLHCKMQSFIALSTELTNYAALFTAIWQIDVIENWLKQTSSENTTMVNKFLGIANAQNVSTNF